MIKVKTKRINGDLFSGLIADVDEEIMNSDDNRLAIDRIVIQHNGGLSDEGAPGMYLQALVPLLITRLGLSRAWFLPCRSLCYH